MFVKILQNNYSNDTKSVTFILLWGRYYDGPHIGGRPHRMEGGFIKIFLETGCQRNLNPFLQSEAVHSAEQLDLRELFLKTADQYNC